MSTQQEAIDLINSGSNVDLSGGAGRGKSWIIHQIMNNKTVLMAPTGIAALNVGGETCHSCIGLPFGIPTEQDKAKTTRTFFELFGNDKVKRIIIDEKGNLRADHLDLIDYKLRKAKNNNLPFGGIQVVLVGDYWQLPPIVSSDEARFYRRLYKSPFVFDSNVYKEAGFKHIELIDCYRQEDLYQVELLDCIQQQKTGWQNAVKELNRICNAKNDDSVLNLCVFNKDADIVNKKHFDRNSNPVKTYKAEITGKFKVKDCLVNQEIHLKEGLRVILCANCEDKTYKNGQMGEVLELNDDCVIVRLDDEEIVQVMPAKWETVKHKNGIKGLTKSVVGTCKQMPIRQGNSISINKSQSLTLDKITINMGKGAFGPALSYVAFSRARDLTNIMLSRKLREEDIIISKRVQQFFNGLKYNKT